MNLLEQMGNSTLPSVIQNPFKKTLIKKICIRYEDYWGRGEWKASGTVQFENGNTKGEQEFNAATFDDCLRQMKAMIESLT